VIAKALFSSMGALGINLVLAFVDDDAVASSSLHLLQELGRNSRIFVRYITKSNVDRIFAGASVFQGLLADVESANPW
jgi:hypothetical protein